MNWGWIALLFAAVLVFGAVVSPPARTEAGGWIIVLGTPLSSQTACELDLASLANIVQARTRLRCMRVEGK
jgi:hypothetical protein